MMDLSFFNRAISRIYQLSILLILYFIFRYCYYNARVLYIVVYIRILLLFKLERCLYVNLPIRKYNRSRKMKKKSSRGLCIRSAAVASYILWPGC